SINSCPRLKESLFFLVIRNQHVLRLAVMIQHHFMVFPAITRLFIATKWRVCRIGMILVYPNTTSLYRTWHLVHFMRIARPDPGSQTIDSVICNFNSLFSCFKGCERNYRSEY